MSASSSATPSRTRGSTFIDPYKQRLLGGPALPQRRDLHGVASSLNVDKRNNRIQATKRHLLEPVLSAELSGGFRTRRGRGPLPVRRRLQFLRAPGQLPRSYYPVVVEGEWLIFKYNGTLGHIGSTDGSVVPYIQRYRAGGIQSVRGYDWYTLGPSIRASRLPKLRPGLAHPVLRRATTPRPPTIKPRSWAGPRPGSTTSSSSCPS